MILQPMYLLIMFIIKKYNAVIDFWHSWFSVPSTSDDIQDREVVLLRNLIGHVSATGVIVKRYSNL